MQNRELSIRAAIDSGDIATAQYLCAQWLIESPECGDARNFSGIVALLRNDFAEAISHFEHATALDSSNAKAWSNLAVAGKNAGRSPEWIADCFRQALLAEPQNREIRYNLALALHDQKNNAEAIVVLTPLLATRDISDKLGWLAANIHYDLGRVEDARQLIFQLVERYPDRFEFQKTLGDLAVECMKFDQAKNAYQNALDLSPDDMLVLRSLGNLFVRMGRLTEGGQCLSRAAKANPEDRECQLSYANALRVSGQFIDARTQLVKALAHWPSQSDVYLNLAIVDGEHGDRELAESEVRQAISLDEKSPYAFNYLGVLLEKKQQYDEAEACYRRAIALDGSLPDPLSNLGNILMGKLQLAEAEQCYRKTIALNPLSAEAAHNLSLLLLIDGRFVEGWEKYAWRWKSIEMREHIRAFMQPEWSGEPLQGKSLLVHAEQGMGDTIQFVRYLQILKKSGCERVILEVPAAIEPLVRNISGADLVIRRNDPLPEFDYHVPLLNVPGIVGTNLETIPASVPYLHASGPCREYWRVKLSNLGSGLKIGIAWAGNPKHVNDRNRSIPGDFLNELTSLPNVHWVSLQKKAARLENQCAGGEPHLLDWTDELHDYADTAGLIEGLDLLISVDTSVAHLAGALAKPVWILLPFAPDWRWLLNRKDSPWYPTARLYRQQNAGDWTGVLQCVRKDLEVICNESHYG
jgi:Flp pilus assembly protein TadD